MPPASGAPNPPAAAGISQNPWAAPPCRRPDRSWVVPDEPRDDVAVGQKDRDHLLTEHPGRAAGAVALVSVREPSWLATIT